MEPTVFKCLGNNPKTIKYSLLVVAGALNWISLKLAQKKKCFFFERLLIPDQYNFDLVADKMGDLI
jgi:hypothetical protein